jgi:hypothetical protein
MFWSLLWCQEGIPPIPTVPLEYFLLSDPTKANYASGLIAKKADLYAVGCFYYDALDDTPHFSDVCAKWEPNSNTFASCPDPKRNKIK